MKSGDCNLERRVELPYRTAKQHGPNVNQKKGGSETLPEIAWSHGTKPCRRRQPRTPRAMPVQVWAGNAISSGTSTHGERYTMRAARMKVMCAQTPCKPTQ